MKIKIGQIITIVSLALFTAACGIKGPPLPPIEETTIQKQKAEEAAKNKELEHKKEKQKK